MSEFVGVERKREGMVGGQVARELALALGELGTHGRVWGNEGLFVQGSIMDGTLVGRIR